jgi:hypothetical protein
MERYSIELVVAAHKYSSLHKNQIMESPECGCFYCMSVFNPSEIVDWVDEDNPLGPTALCPKCGIDSVIGSLSGFPIKDIDFLKQMHKKWF